MARKPHDYRGYLTCLARLQVEPGLGVKVDLSGIVQQTLYEATRDHDADFATWNEPRQKAWLRRLLANNLKDSLRRISTGKRAWGREQSLDAALDKSLEASHTALEKFLEGPESTPSQKAMRVEDFERLARAMEQLPDLQRQAIEAVHLQGRSLADLSTEMNRSKGAIAALLYRGLKQLREWLKEETSCPPTVG